MEAIGAIVGIVLLIWLFSSSGSSKPRSKYEVRETGDSRYSEVINTATGDTEYIGTQEKCEEWIRMHE